MGEVIQQNWPTRLDLPAQRVIDAATKAGLKDVIIIGYDADGDEYFASSIADGGSVLWLLERMKLQLLKVGEE